MKCTFPQEFKIDSLVKILYTSEDRLKWDDQIDKLEVIQNGPHKAHWHEYVLNK